MMYKLLILTKQELLGRDLNTEFVMHADRNGRAGKHFCWSNENYDRCQVCSGAFAKSYRPMVRRYWTEQIAQTRIFISPKYWTTRFPNSGVLSLIKLSEILLVNPFRHLILEKSWIAEKFSSSIWPKENLEKKTVISWDLFLFLES